MLTDLRHTERSTELQSYLLHEWRVWSVVRTIMFRILCFHSLCRGAQLRYKIQQCHCSIAPSAHTSCRQPSPVGLSYHCLMQPSGSHYLRKTSSLSLMALQHHTNTNIALFLADWPLKMIYTAPLSSRRRTTVFWGNLSPL